MTIISQIQESAIFINVSLRFKTKDQSGWTMKPWERKKEKNKTTRLIKAKRAGFGFGQFFFVKKTFGSLPKILAANSSLSSLSCYLKKKKKATCKTKQKPVRPGKNVACTPSPEDPDTGADTPTSFRSGSNLPGPQSAHLAAQTPTLSGPINFSMVQPR